MINTRMINSKWPFLFYRKFLLLSFHLNADSMEDKDIKFRVKKVLRKKKFPKILEEFLKIPHSTLKSFEFTFYKFIKMQLKIWKTVNWTYRKQSYK